MRRRTRNQLTALVVVALVVVLAVWYLTTRPVYFQNATLTQIDYSPSSPYLTFTFSSPLVASQVVGTTATLRDFTVGANSPTDADAAAPLLAALTDGAVAVGAPPPGPTPFVPEYASTNPSVLTTNTLPAGTAAIAHPMTITGQGMMWFAVPAKK